MNNQAKEILKKESGMNNNFINYINYFNKIPGCFNCKWKKNCRKLAREYGTIDNFLKNDACGWWRLNIFKGNFFKNLLFKISRFNNVSNS